MGITSRDLVTDKVFKFKQRIDELRSREYYSDDPKKLLGIFDDIIKQISESIKKVEVEDRISIRRINLLLSFYHLCLDEIEHIEIGNVPVEMLPLFSEILEKFKLKTTFVFRPSPLYNYSYYHISKVVNEINKSRGYPKIQTRDDLAVVSFPSSEKNSALLHCSFAHEVGHHLNESFSIAKEIEPRLLELIDKQLLKEYVTKYLESLSKTKRVIGKTEVTLDKFILEERLTAIVTAELAAIIRKWLDEIVSDIIAMHLFGPAFVYAIAEFVHSSQGPEKYSKTHPPLFIRLKNLMRIFDDIGFSKDLKEYDEAMKRLDFYRKISKKTFESENKTMANIKNMILERGIIGLFVPVKALLDKRLKLSKRICSLKDMKHAVKAFRNLIPGNEVLSKKGTSRPIDAVTILNASWIVRINFVDELYIMLPKTEKSAVRNTLDELTLKSLDLQAFHKRMMKTK